MNRLQRITRRKQRGSQYVPEPKKEAPPAEDTGSVAEDPEVFPQAEGVTAWPKTDPVDSPED